MEWKLLFLFWNNFKFVETLQAQRINFIFPESFASKLPMWFSITPNTLVYISYK